MMRTGVVKTSGVPCEPLLEKPESNNVGLSCLGFGLLRGILASFPELLSFSGHSDLYLVGGSWNQFRALVDNRNIRYILMMGL